MTNPWNDNLSYLVLIRYRITFLLRQFTFHSPAAEYIVSTFFLKNSISIELQRQIILILQVTVSSLNLYGDN